MAYLTFRLVLYGIRVVTEADYVENMREIVIQDNRPQCQGTITFKCIIYQIMQRHHNPFRLATKRYKNI